METESFVQTKNKDLTVEDAVEVMSKDEQAEKDAGEVKKKFAPKMEAKKAEVPPAKK